MEMGSLLQFILELNENVVYEALHTVFLFQLYFMISALWTHSWIPHHFYNSKE